MKIQLKVDGMDCSGCVRAVHNVLSRVEAVSGVEVKLETGEAIVTADAGVDPKRLVAAVEGAGYSARIASADA